MTENQTASETVFLFLSPQSRVCVRSGLYLVLQGALRIRMGLQPAIAAFAVLPLSVAT